MPKPKSTIAFYNLENLFDTQNDPHIFDDNFTPKGDLHWHSKRYRKKTSAIISRYM